MKIVLDTSAAVRVVLDRNINFIKTLLAADQVIVPHLFFAETGNVFLKYHQFRSLPKEDCILYMSLCRQLVTDTFDEIEIAEEIWDTALKQHLSYYDAIYLTIAYSLGAKLLTDDKKLNKMAVELGLSLE